MCEDSAKKRMSSVMAGEANPVDAGQPTTLDELGADEDGHEEQMSENTLPTEERAGLGSFPQRVALR